jgi:membrane protein DedA with SNARE-associated domain
MLKSDQWRTCSLALSAPANDSRAQQQITLGGDFKSPLCLLQPSTVWYAKYVIALFSKWGTGTLVASTAIPFPFPTSLVFATAGASEYPLGRYLSVVAISRGVRYGCLALLVERFGRHLVRVVAHPTQYWGWFLLFSAVVLVLIGGGILVNRRLLNAPAQ